MWEPPPIAVPYAYIHCSNSAPSGRVLISVGSPRSRIASCSVETPGTSLLTASISKLLACCMYTHPESASAVIVTMKAFLIFTPPLTATVAFRLTLDHIPQIGEPQQGIRNAERDQIGMVGDIIADSWATSPGIRSGASGGVRDSG